MISLYWSKELVYSSAYIDVDVTMLTLNKRYYSKILFNVCSRHSFSYNTFVILGHITVDFSLLIHYHVYDQNTCSMFLDTGNYIYTIKNYNLYFLK